MRFHADKTPLVTVVVPVYNVAPYLHICLESVASQTYENLEVVVVDDGSTDGGAEICDQVALHDCRFSVVHIENRGLSAARNEGLLHAVGDYLVFLDSDDWIEPNAVEVLVAVALHEGAGVVTCRYARERLDGTRMLFPEHSASGLMTASEALHALVCERCISETAWGKLFRRDLLTSLRFVEGMVCEDVESIWRIVAKAEIVCCVDDVLFHYRERPNSITDGASLEMLSGRWRAFSSRYKGLSSHSPDLHDATLRQCAGTVVYINTQLHAFPSEKRTQFASELAEMRCFVREHSLEVLRARNFSLRLKLAFVFARWNGPIATAAFSYSTRLCNVLAMRFRRAAREGQAH